LDQDPDVECILSYSIQIDAVPYMDMDPDRQTFGLQKKNQRRKNSRVWNWWMFCLEGWRLLLVLGSPLLELGRNMDIFCNSKL
jgi:hypothetical protein